jgi:erythritol transport system ATP-binding protein
VRKTGAVEMIASPPDLILEARNITKRYPGTVALDRVTFRVHRNKVNVLLGETAQANRR